MKLAREIRSMTTATLSPANVPTPSALALAPLVALVWTFTQLLRFMILAPALMVAAIRHRRRAMDPVSVWQWWMPFSTLVLRLAGTRDVSR